MGGSELVWALFSHWDENPLLWRMDFEANPRALFSALLDAHYGNLVIVKAFEAPRRKQAELEQRFQNCHYRGRWYTPSAQLRRFLEEAVACETMEAKRLWGDEWQGRITWRPTRADRQAALEAAQVEDQLPPFVNNAKTFVIWAIDDVRASGLRCSSRDVITHRANLGIYRAQTIYNTISAFVDEGKIVKSKRRELWLSEEAQTELDGLRAAWQEKAAQKTRTLRM